MRDGRRQRLGLATGTEDPATSNDGYLDRILSDQEAAGQSNILNLAEDANVNVRDQRYLNDAYQYYLGGGTGNFADEVAIDTPATTDLGEITADGGGTGQATSGVDLGNNLGFNAGVTPGPSGFIGLDPDMDIAPTDITDYGTYDPPELGGVDGMSGGQATPGAEFADQNPYGGDGTMNDLGADNFDTFEEVEPQSQLASEMIAERNAANRTDGLEDYLDGFDTVPEADNSIPDEYDQEINNVDFSKPNIGEISGPTTMTVDELAASSADQGLEAFDPSAVSQAFTAGKQAIASGISTVAEVGQSIADTIGGIYNGVDQTVSVFGREINIPSTLAGIALNQVVGAPISLAFNALKAIAGMLPEDSLENSTKRSIAAQLTANNTYGYNMGNDSIGQDPFGRNPVSAFGNYEQTLAEDAAYIGDSKFSNAKKQYAEDYFNAKAQVAGGVGQTSGISEEAGGTGMVSTGDVLGPGEFLPEGEDLVSLEEQLKSQPVTVENISGDYSPDDDDPADDGPAPSVPEADNSMPDEYDEPDYDPGPFDYQVQPTYQTGTTTRPGSGGGGGGNDSSGKSIVCTAMYQTTGLEDWSKAMKIWYIYQKKYLTIQHQEGYHKLFKPFVKGMHKSQIIRAIGAHVAKHRTQDLKHVMFGSRSSWLGRMYRKILEPVCYLVGKYVK